MGLVAVGFVLSVPDMVLCTPDFDGLPPKIPLTAFALYAASHAGGVPASGSLKAPRLAPIEPLDEEQHMLMVAHALPALRLPCATAAQ